MCRYVACHEYTNIKQTSYIFPGNTKDKCNNVSKMSLYFYHRTFPHIPEDSNIHRYPST